MDRTPDMRQVGEAARIPGTSPRPTDSRNQHPNQERYDGNDGQKFDERQTSRTRNSPRRVTTVGRSSSPLNGGSASLREANFIGKNRHRKDRSRSLQQAARPRPTHSDIPPEGREGKGREGTMRRLPPCPYLFCRPLLILVLLIERRCGRNASLFRRFVRAAVSLAPQSAIRYPTGIGPSRENRELIRISSCFLVPVTPPARPTRRRASVSLHRPVVDAGRGD